jgi:hypothetical protein
MTMSYGGGGGGGGYGGGGGARDRGYGNTNGTSGGYVHFSYLDTGETLVSLSFDDERLTMQRCYLSRSACLHLAVLAQC